MRLLNLLLPILLICVGLLPDVFATLTFDNSVSVKQRHQLQTYFDKVSGLIHDGKYANAFTAMSSPKVVVDNQVMGKQITITSGSAFATIFEAYKSLGQLSVSLVSCSSQVKNEYEAHGTLKAANLPKPFKLTTSFTVNKPIGSPGLKVTSAKIIISL